LNYVPILFPQYHVLVLAATENKRKESLAWLQQSMQELVTGNPKSQHFYDVVKPLIHL
jgi:hypothetical protein